MNKKWMMGLLVITMLVSVGCSAKTPVEAEASSNMSVNSEVDKEDSSEANNDIVVETQGTDKVKSSKDAQMYMGKIVTVYGNYIQLNKVDMPERGMGDRTSTTENKNTDTEKSQTNIGAAVSGQSGGGGMARVPGSGGGRFSGEQDYEFTGDIVDIMIPVGSEIRSMTETSLELSYDNLKKGMVVRVVVDQTMTDEFQDSTEVETFYANSVFIME